jgi:superfamily II DNA or RNA helicase
VLPTGGGKTVVFGAILRNHSGSSVAIAHRRELVGQMSNTLARLQLRHRIIAPTPLIKEIVSLHIANHGRSYYDPNAACAVAGVDTIARRDLGSWQNRVTLWVTDEAHHLLRENKWGKAVEMFPHARGLGVTATPMRADGKGLGRHADGVMDALVVGPGMRELISDGYLTDYRIFAPASDIDLSKVPVSAATGDFQSAALREAARKSHITGDIVDSYLRIARGKLGVTFCVSIELAQETAARFRAAGVPAECVSSETPEVVRAAALRRFAAREILQLVNVDLFGEGFDLPALEVVSMGRPTESFGLYAQQFGRALRPLEGKTEAIIIDHVGNVIRHGLPDGYREWTLDRRAKRSRSTSDEIPLRACPQCTGVYERFHRECPYCGYFPEPTSRSAPEHVDGDLLEMDASFLAQLRGGGDLMQPPKIPYGATPEVRGSILKRHREWVETQVDLRKQIAWWAGWQRSLGRNDSEGYRRFYHEFGVDVASAQTLKTKEATELGAKLRGVLHAKGVAIE